MFENGTLDSRNALFVFGYVFRHKEACCSILHLWYWSIGYSMTETVALLDTSCTCAHILCTSHDLALWTWYLHAYYH